MEHIDVKLLQQMAKNNIRQISELQELTGLSRRTISKLLNGQSSAIHFETLAILCKKLDCEISELIVLK